MNKKNIFCMWNNAATDTYFIKDSKVGKEIDLLGFGRIKQILDKIVKQTKVGQDNWQIDQFEKLTLVQIFITLLCATAVLYVMIW